MINRPDSLNLANWRQSPHNRWAFHHVRDIIANAPIYRGNKTARFTDVPAPAVAEVKLAGLEGAMRTLAR